VTLEKFVFSGTKGQSSIERRFFNWKIVNLGKTQTKIKHKIKAGKPY
jgi:hypothetical protein